MFYLPFMSKDMRERIKMLRNYSDANPSIVTVSTKTEDPMNEIEDTSEKLESLEPLESRESIEEDERDNEKLCIVMKSGIKLYYSNQVQNNKRVRRLSLSSNDKNKYPNYLAINLILKEFGFRNNLKKNGLIVWSDYDNSGKGFINFVESIDLKEERVFFGTLNQKVFSKRV